MKVRSAGLHVVPLPLVIFTDDTSGNKSKKWNKFEWWGFTLGGLPQSECRKPSNIHFISCSNKVPILDMAVPIVEQLNAAEDGFEAYDNFLDQRVYVTAPVLIITVDNVRHSELINHLGSNAKKFCRFCTVNADILNKHCTHIYVMTPSLLQAEKESGMFVGDLRSKTSSIAQMDLIKKKHTENDKKQARTLYGLKECPNPMFSLNVDLFRYVLVMLNNLTPPVDTHTFKAVFFLIHVDLHQLNLFTQYFWGLASTC